MVFNFWNVGILVKYLRWLCRVCACDVYISSEIPVGFYWMMFIVYISRIVYTYSARCNYYRLLISTALCTVLPCTHEVCFFDKLLAKAQSDRWCNHCWAHAYHIPSSCSSGHVTWECSQLMGRPHVHTETGRQISSSLSISECFLSVSHNVTSICCQI